MSSFSPYAAKLAGIPASAHSVSVMGVTTHYWRYGPPEAFPQLVMVHGFRGDHHGLEPIVAELGGDVSVVIPDLPGFGESDTLLGVSDITHYSRWLQEFFSAVCASPETTATASATVILGHSFGSIVVAAALSDGLPTTRAILINPIAANALKGPNGFMTRLAVAYYKAAAALPEKAGFALLKNAAIVRVMSMTMAKTKDPALRAWIHHQHDTYFSKFASRASVLEAFETSVGNDVSQYADALASRDPKTQLLLLVADKDDITALPEQVKLAARIPGAQLEVVSGVGHLVHYEAPDFAARHIRAFLGLAPTKTPS